jgi:hypothetical protein
LGENVRGKMCVLWAWKYNNWAQEDVNTLYILLNNNKVSVTNQCAHFLVVIFFPLMNLVEVDVLLTAPPPVPPTLLRDENDVKAS